MDKEEILKTLGWSRDGIASSDLEDNRCPVCKGLGLEYYTKMIGGNEYEYVRDCPRCNGATEKAIAERIECSGIPNRYVHNTRITDFKTDVYGAETIEPQMKAINSFIERFYTWENAGQGLYIYSATKGSGKTFLASCIANELMQRYVVPVRFVSASDLLDLSKEDGAITDLIKARLLVIDDLGAKTGGQAWMSDVMFKIADSRYQNKKPTIYTSNIKMANLPLDERIIDRISDACFNLSLPEVPVRLNKSNSNKKDFLKKVGLL